MERGGTRLHPSEYMLKCFFSELSMGRSMSHLMKRTPGDVRFLDLGVGGRFKKGHKRTQSGL